MIQQQQGAGAHHRSSQRVKQAKAAALTKADEEAQAVAVLRVHRRNSLHDGAKDAGRAAMHNSLTGGSLIRRLANNPKATVEMMVERLREERAKLEVQSAVNYIIFLALFTYVTLSGQNASEKYSLSNELKNLLGQEEVLPAIASMDDVYAYFENRLPTVLYKNTFDGDNSFAQGTLPGSASSLRGDLLGANKVLGGVRFGQLRTIKRSCSLPGFLEAAHAGATCAREWDPEFESTATFGNAGTEFRYTPTSRVRGMASTSTPHRGSL